jgi:hypothetical protein
MAVAIDRPIHDAEIDAQHHPVRPAAARCIGPPRPQHTDVPAGQPGGHQLPTGADARRVRSAPLHEAGRPDWRGG